MPPINIGEPIPSLQHYIMKKFIPALALAIVAASGAAAQAAEAFKTAQGQVVVSGLRPGRLYGVIANTGNGVGVKNFTSTACGEVIIERAANFQSITIDRKKLTPKTLGTKAYTKCTKALPPATPNTRTR
jgi:opacity protein-like surface antigen